MNDLKKRLLNAYKEIHKKTPKEYNGAMKISIYLKLSKKEHGSRYWKTHKHLLELKKDGYLEQKFGYGFRFRK